MHEETKEKKEILRKAIRLAVIIFLLSLGLFVGIVIVIAKFATKTVPR